MSDYIKAMRLAANIYAVLVIFASFKIAHLDLGLAVLPAIAVLAAGCATMVQNDLRDREHDRKKGKTHTAEHEREYVVFALALWLVSLGLAILLGVVAGKAAMSLVLIIIVVGLVYSEVLLVPWLPNFLVALCSAVATLFPLCYGTLYPEKVWLIATVVFGTIYGREVIKDLEDQEIDAGHKWTVPVAKGYAWARWVAMVAFVIGTIPLFPLIPDGRWRAFGCLPLPGIVAIMKFCEGYKLSQRDHKVLKFACDMGMLFVLLLLIILGQYS